LRGSYLNESYRSIGYELIVADVHRVTRVEQGRDGWSFTCLVHWRSRTQAGLAVARRAGRTGGRPPKLTDDDIEAAKAMLANSKSA